MSAVILKFEARRHVPRHTAADPLVALAFFPFIAATVYCGLVVASLETFLPRRAP